MDPSVASVNESVENFTEITSRKRRKSSTVWNDFDLIPASENEDGKSRGKCKHCLKEYLADSNYGTSTMRRHLKQCSKLLISDEVRYKIDQNSYKEHVALAIIRHGYTFTFAEHESNRDLHVYLNHDVNPICRNTAKAYCLKIHKRESDILKNVLAEVPGRICLTSDIWTSCTSEGYLCLTAHYVDTNWKLCSKILNFFHVSPPHTAVMLYEKVHEKLKFWGIEKKIFTITLDNARNNDNMQELLKDQLSSHDYLIYNGEYFHVRCGAHILNLIVQEGLKVIEKSVACIRDAVKYVTGSEARKIKFAECVNDVGLDFSRGLWLDCSTRWNSTYVMLERALSYRKAFSKLKKVDKCFIWDLTTVQWSLVEKLCDLLKPFQDITDLFSGTRYPTANLYFYSVFRIHLLLMKGRRSEDDCIKEMASSMLEKFDKYWQCYSVVLSFAVILDPQYKFRMVNFTYRKLYWVDEVVQEKCNEIKDMLYALFEAYVSDNKISEVYRERGHCSDDDMMKEFDSLEDSLGSELDGYLSEPRIARTPHFDVLSWWKDNQSKYLILSMMARDVLSIPITTVASESAFSMGGRILSKWRASLLPENAEALITTRSWLFGFEADETYDKCGLEFKFSKPSHTVSSSSRTD